MGGFLIPDDYKVEHSTRGDSAITSICWGLQIGFTILTASKAGAQTVKIWERTNRITGYIILVWLEILTNTALGILSWLYMNETISASFAYFFILLTLWCFELHFLIQIIVNRLAILIRNRRRLNFIRWGSVAIILFINISVYCIWLPARLQISQTYIEINNVWDRVEKVIYLLLDGALNIYFIYMVKSKLISTGVTKYWPLFKFTIIIVGISLSMDILLIGTMSLRNGLIYVQFHPLVYMIKLNCEMSMAHMISKVAKSPNGSGRYHDPDDLPVHGVTSDVKMASMTGDTATQSAHVRSKHQSVQSLSVPKSHTMSRNRDHKNPFDPTITEILNEEPEHNSGRLYHAWVSAGDQRHGRTGDKREFQVSRKGSDESITIVNDARDRSGSRMARVGEEEGNVIMKDTTVHVRTESFDPVDMDRRAPSESESTAHLKP